MTTPTVITVANIKGGVGKSTTAWMLARLLQPQHTVLLIDMDPNAVLTRWSRVAAGSKHIGHVLGGANQPSATLRSAARLGHHDIAIVPANPDLANVAHGLHNRMFDRFTALADAITSTGNDWDIIIIDAPGGQDALAINALAPAHTYIIPTQPEPASIEGMIKTSGLISQVHRATARQDGYTTHVLITLADERTRQHQDGISRIKKTVRHFGHIIPRRNGADADQQLLDAYRPLAEEIAQ